MNILWDFDGTLFDTYTTFTEVMHDVLEGSVPPDEIFKQLKISFTHATTIFQLTKEQIIEFKKREKAVSPEIKRPFPFVEDVIKKANLNVIMTHKPREEVNTILQYYNWNDFFEEIVAGDDGYPRKPDPTSYIYLHKKYKLDLVVGDRLLDIVPAKEIGLHTCLFQNKSQGADFYLDSYEKFFQTIKINR